MLELDDVNAYRLVLMVLVYTMTIIYNKEDVYNAIQNAKLVEDLK